MIPLIGMIVATYAIVRLLQTPLQMAVYEPRFMNMTPQTRLGLVTMLSIGGAMAVGVLAMQLMETSARAGANIPGLLN